MLQIVIAAAVLAEDTGIDANVFAQYGVLGVITLGLIWFAKGTHQREVERANRMEEENKRLNGLLLDRVIPALTSATRVLEESAELLSAIQRERQFNQLSDQQQRRASKGGA